MAKDLEINIMQHTAAQIERKCNKYTKTLEMIESGVAD